MRIKRLKQFEKKLKPCPYCNEPMFFDINKRGGAVFLECRNTDCLVMPLFYTEIHDDDHIKRNAIKILILNLNSILFPALKAGGAFVHVQLND